MNTPATPPPDTAPAPGSLSTLAESARQAFRSRIGGEPEFLVQAPGRVNLIGEHTDYNGGRVLPMAIDRWTVIAGRARKDRRVRLASDAGDGWLECDLDRLVPGSHVGWGAYAAGVLAAVGAPHPSAHGWEGVTVSNLPIGAGLSSSAAFELSVAAAATMAGGIPWDPRAMALAGQQAEHTWVGTRCGLMDQLSVALGVAGHALRIDCRDHSAQAVRVPDELSIVILDTGRRRQLATSAYNARRDDCARAAAAAGVDRVGDLDPSHLETLRPRMDPVAFRRAHHVVTENARVDAFITALGEGRWEDAGRCLDGSHRSLSEDFEVSCPELDLMVSLAGATPGCLGARLTGAGFGGCVVALVRTDAAAGFGPAVTAAYRTRCPLEPAWHRVKAVAGAGPLSPAGSPAPWPAYPGMPAPGSALSSPPPAS